MNRKSYLTFSLSLCVAVFTPSTPFVYTPEHRALIDAIEQGYHWVRTDGMLAVFERDEAAFHKFASGPTLDLSEVAGYQYDGSGVRVVMKGGAEFKITCDKEALDILDRVLLKKGQK